MLCAQAADLVGHGSMKWPPQLLDAIVHVGNGQRIIRFL
ncbi:hypothetical protein AWB65_05062 [Caballeronia humi]|uniref:Uncharacterized protein n=1 Tax=Caballeronia humi TaxID=326474 RepID=A0A158IMH6_9BURK|nr:hypothetical protein AWB65_05062 [Caballeronia humi]